MSHEIDMSNARANMAYKGEVPWHGLGAVMEPGADLDEWTAAAGLGYRVASTPVLFTPAGRVMPGSNVLFREDTLAPLGICSDKYKIVQPVEILEFFRELVKEDRVEIETAGALFGGKRVWATAKLSEGAEVMKGDRVEPYVLLTTSYDGSSSTRAILTSVRVVCRNTLNLAMSESKTRVSIRHTSNFDPKAVRAELGLGALVGKFDAWMQAARGMAEKEMGGYAFDRFLLKTLRATEETEKVVRDSLAYRRITALFEGAAVGSELVNPGTEWAALNAVTEYADHRKGNQAWTASNFNNSLLGDADAMKRRAWKALEDGALAD